MNNQIILWSLMIVPWITIFFLKREEIKHYMPVALLATITSIVAMESGIGLNLWHIREDIYPLSQIMPYSFGLVPVVTIWLFKYTFEKFWLFVAVDSVFNIFFAFVFTPWLEVRGIKDLTTSNLTVFLITVVLGILLYGYQMWQEEVLVTAERHQFSPTLQPAAKKDFSKEQDNKDRK